MLHKEIQPQKSLQISPLIKVQTSSRGKGRSTDSLGLCLLGDVPDGGPFLADDSTHILCGHQKTEGNVNWLLFDRCPCGDRRTLPGGTTCPKPTPPPILWSLHGLLIRDVGDLQSMVLQLVPIQLHDGSGRQARREGVGVVDVPPQAAAYQHHPKQVIPSLAPNVH